jgi:toxin ParE1/3/4
MPHEVRLTTDAERDLESLYDYIAEFDSRANANRVLDRLLKAAEGLAVFPERGSHPRELQALGIREYRQIFFKPYRLVYRIIGQQVFIVLIADGRRDMQTLLARRLLGT